MAEHNDSLESALLSALLATTHDFVYFKDSERRFLRISKSFERLLGRPEREIIGRRDEELFPPEIARDTVADDTRVIATGEPLTNKVEGGEVAPGVESWVLTTKMPWLDADGRTLGLCGISREFTELKHLRDAVESSARRLRVLADTVPIPLGATRVRDGALVFANRALSDFFGLAPDKLHGERVPALYADDRERAALVERVEREGRVVNREVEITRVDGDARTISLSAAPLDVDGERAIISALVDITELKKHERSLRRLSREKDALLREVNHRVNNNLTTLLSLVARGRRSVGESAELPALERLENAIRGLSTVHVMLSDSTWSPLALTSLCERLVISTTADERPPPEFHINGSSVRVSSQTANTLALVICELALNTLKHADVRPARIDVEVGRDGEDITIRYRDNGVGFSESALAGARRGEGMGLVRVLVAHTLGGSMTVSNDDGAVTLIRFPEPGTQ